jgi:hypothetical protein
MIAFFGLKLLGMAPDLAAFNAGAGWATYSGSASEDGHEVAVTRASCD